MYHSKHVWSVLPGVCTLALLAATAGCETTRATFLQPTCQRIEQGKTLTGLAFTASIETRGLAGEQLIYEVTLRNGALRPIKSTDGRYQNKAGVVAASKTLMVLQSPVTFDAVRVSIPLEELQIRNADWPVSAVFRLYNTAGECLAQASCAVPSGPAKREAATTTAPTKPPPGREQKSTSRPTSQPTVRPATQPTTRPAAQPTSRPTSQPTTRPTKPRPEPTERKATPPSRPTRPRGRSSQIDYELPIVATVTSLD